VGNGGDAIIKTAAAAKTAAAKGTRLRSREEVSAGVSLNCVHTIKRPVVDIGPLVNRV